MNMYQIDPALTQAESTWKAALDAGKKALEAKEYANAIAQLSDAVQQSAHFHPLFHFLESGLNTELALLHLSRGEFDEAHKHFIRAVFLDHENATAKQGAKQADEEDKTPLPAYGMERLLADFPKPETKESIWQWRAQAMQAQGDEAIALYQLAIAQCETTHEAYHKAAAQPWLWRAKSFLAQGERALAKNDGRRGLDLDKQHPDLLSMANLSLSA